MLRDTRLTEDRVQLACEERLQEYKDFTKLKAKIKQACEAWIEEYKASNEMKEKLYDSAFCMFASGFNQGLKAARDTPSTPLAAFRAPKVDSDGKDDNPLPKGALLPPAGP